MPAYKLFSTSGDQTIDMAVGTPVIVGRAATSTVPIYDPTISRVHAELTQTNGGVMIKDKGSANGTFLNGTRVSEAVAADGDVVTFGKVAFHVKEVTAPQKKAPTPSPEGFAAKPPPGATLVRPMMAPKPPPKPGAEAAGESHVKVGGGTMEERQARKLAVLLDISKELSRQQNVDTLLEKVVDITFEVMAVDRVAIAMQEPTSGETIPRTAKNRLGGGGVRIPSSIAQPAVQQRIAILTDNAAADERFKGKSIVMQSVRSAMCAPLMGSDGSVLGLIYVDNSTATNSFGADDLDFLIAFSGIAAIAIENSNLTDRVRREAVVRANFQRYFAPNVAEQIASHEGGIELGGTKRPVVVFFSDIRGFTSMSEKMSPDEIATLLTEYFTEMVEIIFEHGGTLDKFIGDAIMALWGAPIAHEDDTDRAMKAAMAMEQILEQLNVKWKAQGRPKVGIGIGINFGEVFAGNIGSDKRLEYTVIGDAVNTASRLCSKAAAGEIMISEPFLKALKNPPKVDTLEPMALKGKAQAVQVYRVKR
jgi:adenylate cyclase